MKNKDQCIHLTPEILYYSWVGISCEDFIFWNVLVDSLSIYKPEYISETIEETLVLVCQCQGKGWYNIAHDIPVAQKNAWHILDAQ